MVLSGPEAAALLAQAGISLGDQEQVMMGGGGGGKTSINIKHQNLSTTSGILFVSNPRYIHLPPQLDFFSHPVLVLSDSENLLISIVR